MVYWFRNSIRVVCRNTAADCSISEQVIDGATELRYNARCSKSIRERREPLLETSGTDETLARAWPSTMSVPELVPPIVLAIADFDYTIEHRSLTQQVMDRFGESLRRPLPQEHVALIERGDEQLPADQVLVERMVTIQQEALMG